jgi:hypothetical protein
MPRHIVGSLSAATSPREGHAAQFVHHPHTPIVDATIQLAAAPMLLEEGVEIGD